MKRFLAALLALIVLAAPALAEAQLYEGERFSISLPEELAVLSAETVEGYLQAATQDIEDALGAAGEEPAEANYLLVAATADGASSLNIVATPSDGRSAEELALAASEDLKDLVAGLTGSGLTSGGEVNGMAYSSVSYSLYGSDLAQYYMVVGDTVYCLTFANLEQAVIDDILASFTARE